MKTFLTFIIVFISVSISAQTLKILKSETQTDLDFGKQVQADWERLDQLLVENADWSNFSKEDNDLIAKYDAEVMEGMWDILGGGCSWYCGAGAYTVSTSSNLAEQYENTYDLNNLTDFSYETAWIEGVKGYGFGETIVFEFSPEHPRVTEVSIVNGYVKSESAWKNNSRVKTLKMYVDDVPYGLIELEDVYATQSFKVDPIGHSARDKSDHLSKLPTFKIKFEIIAIYKGDRYDDTAITEIYFDGLDVH